MWSRPRRRSPARAPAPGDRPHRGGTAAGIYGVIIAAAVMASSHAASAGAVIAAVLVTLSSTGARNGTPASWPNGP